MVKIFTESVSGNIKRTFGGISVNACAIMNDNYGTGGTAMTDTWHCFGDPSLEVRSNTPTQITATHNLIEPLGISQFTINCNTDGALACISMNGEILGTGYVSGGLVTINFSSPLSVVDTFQITITSYNCKPYLADVALIPATGPYVICALNTINDATGNNNGLPDFSETISLNISVDNLGVAVANNVVAVLSTLDSFIVINTSSYAVGNIAASATIALSNAFSYTIANTIPDQHQVLFTLTFTDAIGNVWTSNFTQVINAPKFEVQTIAVNDITGGNGNGMLEPGETADITITSKNNGHASSDNANDLITTTSSFISFNGNAATSLGIINANSLMSSTFNVSLANTITLGTLIDFNYHIGANAYTAAKQFYLKSGELLEDFETNDFTKNPWTFEGDANWFTTANNSFQGNFCSQSGVIANNQKTDLVITLNVLADDSISFYSKVSSEANFDFLKFYMDGDKQAEWSGLVNWQYNSYPIGTGVHILKWSYAKDNSVIGGDDAAWLDNISFPPFANIVSAVIETTDNDNGFSVSPNPVTDVANINFNLTTADFVTIKLFDSNGKEVRIMNRKRLDAGQHAETFNVANLASGLYLVQLQTASKTTIKKILIGN